MSCSEPAGGLGKDVQQEEGQVLFCLGVLITRYALLLLFLLLSTSPSLGWTKNSRQKG